MVKYTCLYISYCVIFFICLVLQSFWVQLHQILQTVVNPCTDNTELEQELGKCGDELLIVCWVGRALTCYCTVTARMALQMNTKHMAWECKRRRQRPNVTHSAVHWQKKSCETVSMKHNRYRGELKQKRRRLDSVNKCVCYLGILGIICLKFESKFCLWGELSVVFSVFVWSAFALEFGCGICWYISYILFFFLDLFILVSR